MDKQRRFNFFTIMILTTLALCPSCYYHFGHGQLAENYKTISIPYVDGDKDGHLTAEIIQKIALSGAFKYVPCAGDLTLNIKILSVKDLTIGYRYDRKRDRKIKHALIPSESRITAIAEVSILDTRKNETIHGPAQLTAKLDYDFDYYKIQHEVNVYSLGQVSDVDSARDAVQHPLNCKLAELIVEYVVNTW